MLEDYKNIYMFLNVLLLPLIVRKKASALPDDLVMALQI